MELDEWKVVLSYALNNNQYKIMFTIQGIIMLIPMKIVTC